MPDYEIRDERTGRVVVVSGAKPPSPQDIAMILHEVNGPARTEDFMDKPAQPEGSAAGRFLSNAGEVLNPMTAIQGLWGALRHPIDTASNVLDAQVAQGRKAADRFREGRYLEAAGHGAASVLPLIGPAAAEAGEQIAQGDIAGGLGRSTGLVVPAAAPTAIRGATSAAVNAAPTRLAGWLETGAADRIADVMSPKVGPNKTRFGNRADEVAPKLANDPAMAKWSREGMHVEVQNKLTAAERALDEAQDARLSARTFNTEPLINDLLKKRRELTAESVDASDAARQPAGPPTTRTTMGVPGQSGPSTSKVAAQSQPLGKDVVPAPNAARVAQIDQAIAELRQLGPVARYESIRRVRQAYDGPAKVKYNPSMTADFLKNQGGATGAADVTGVLREHLAKFDPQTAAANADYSLYRTANDVLEATAEVQRTRPTVGRQIVARLTGSVVGGQAAGTAGAVSGYLLGPVVETAVTAGVTSKLKTAGMMAALARAIRTGEVQTVVRLSDQLKRLGAQAAVLSTNPNESRRPPAAASPALPSR